MAWRLGVAYDEGQPLSTRRLILAALLCGLAILVAAALQFVLIART